MLQISWLWSQLLLHCSSCNLNSLCLVGELENPLARQLSSHMSWPAVTLCSPRMQLGLGNPPSMTHQLGLYPTQPNLELWLPLWHQHFPRVSSQTHHFVHFHRFNTLKRNSWTLVQYKDLSLFQILLRELSEDMWMSRFNSLKVELQIL